MLKVKQLAVAYGHGASRMAAVRGVDFEVPRGAAVALVGESGSGKSTIALSIMRLIDANIGEITGGDVLFEGESLVSATRNRMREVLHKAIGYVPQDPMTALDPLCTIGRHIDETLTSAVPKNRRKAAIAELLESLGMPQSASRLGSYPHEMSGGLKQRVAIATALAREPRLIIADEPTSALDVTTQLAILRVFHTTMQERQLSLLFVTHDLLVARALCQQLVVLYAGRVVESGATRDLMSSPQHPYTHALVKAIPATAAPRSRLFAVPGTAASARSTTDACQFAPRCPLADDRCRFEVPPVIENLSGTVACWKPGEMAS
ncbi:ABC transporter ATP-binding protein [Pseudonocardia sp. GCM10023141]|uniref:ABC transporter ATP-binding protein n=1 Tax=Pseudonocardia sp. GCM10023141 TaxID=3252653 RepID=UPI00361D8517